ncbi:MAG: gamma-glutamylcyclotransferase [Burkholderiaceae bacterium]|nr:gamma-glutamylcyclotransferase [Burkholderiaceae bacterium]
MLQFDDTPAAAVDASSHSHQLTLRDPQPLLERTLAQWGGREDLWLFAYGSLIWRPDFHAQEQRSALLHGFHRALRMRSRVNRGSPQEPGLVFALLSGGSCRGLVYRIGQAEAEATLTRLWAREMPTGVYDPQWVGCRTAEGEVKALAFTLSRRSPGWTGPLDDARLLHIFRHAQGRYGSTLDYLLQTAASLSEHGIHDREVQRQVALARRHGLAP